MGELVTRLHVSFAVGNAKAARSRVAEGRSARRVVLEDASPRTGY